MKDNFVDTIESDEEYRDIWTHLKLSKGGSQTGRVN